MQCTGQVQYYIRIRYITTKAKQRENFLRFLSVTLLQGLEEKEKGEDEEGERAIF